MRARRRSQRSRSPPPRCPLRTPAAPGRSSWPPERPDIRGIGHPLIECRLTLHDAGGTPAGRRPVKEFIATLSDTDAAAIAAAMRDVRANGLAVARHLRGDIYEVRADGDRQAFRIVFASEGRRGRVLLALEGFSKKTQRTPPEKIRLAERRLADWRRRADD